MSLLGNTKAVILNTHTQKKKRHPVPFAKFERNEGLSKEWTARSKGPCSLPSASSEVSPRNVCSLEVSAILESKTDESTSRLRTVPKVLSAMASRPDSVQEKKLIEDRRTLRTTRAAGIWHYCRYSIILITAPEARVQACLFPRGSPESQKHTRR